MPLTVPLQSRPVLCLLVVLLALGAGGCTDRPRAPALQNQPVYQDDQEGLRFLAPEGWKQHSRANLPATRLTTERLLVEYRLPRGPTNVRFLVSRIDLPESASLQDALKERALPAEDPFRPVGTPESIQLGGIPALRVLAEAGGDGKEKMLREVVVARRGPRVYFFTTFLPAANARAREQVRQALASVLWQG